MGEVDVPNVLSRILRGWLAALLVIWRLRIGWNLKERNVAAWEQQPSTCNTPSEASDER